MKEAGFSQTPAAVPRLARPAEQKPEQFEYNLPRLAAGVHRGTGERASESCRRAHHAICEVGD